MLSSILIVCGIVRGYFGSILEGIGVLIDGFIFGAFSAFFILYYWFSGQVTTEGKTFRHFYRNSFNLILY